MIDALKALGNLTKENILNKREQTISREQVISAYKLLLNREPEDEEVINQKMQSRSLEGLILEFIQSKEFEDKYGSRFLQNEGMYSIKEIDLTIASVMFDIRQSIERSKENEPSLENISSQLCTASQFSSDIYKKWCDKFNERPRLHRKQWEFVYTLEALYSKGCFGEGSRGLGFGCGKEPLPAVMASMGCDILATDLDPNDSVAQGWSESNQHAAKIEDLYWPGVCDKNEFMKRVSYKSVDMNNIPKNFKGYDFVWSSCAFEHLGSIRKGMDFVINSIKCLKPGGVAVHTTEFNLTSNDATFETDGLVFYRRKDIDQLAKELETEGCTVEPLNYFIGERVEDGFVDLPPFKSAPHLKLAMFGYLTTSIGIIATKK